MAEFNPRETIRDKYSLHYFKNDSKFSESDLIQILQKMYDESNK